MKKSKKILAVLLTVLTVVGIFSCATTVWAEEYNEYVETKAYEEKLLTETVDSESEKAEIICEVEEKREEYSKTYKREDGSFTKIFSQIPLHSYENGVWEDIDNTLNLNGNVIENTNGKFNVEFPEILSSNDKITIENQGENISFSINDIGESVAEVVSKEENSDIVEKDLGKTISEITYENVGENTDVQYIVSSNSVKENIIVNDKSGLKDTYSFDIEKGNLTATLDDSNNLSFKNDRKEIVFTIPAPVMTDANNAVSYDIDVKVENADKSVLTLTYTPSKEWLNSRDRVYPITIDPVINTEDLDNYFIETAMLLYHSEDISYENQNFNNENVGVIAKNAENSGLNITEAELLLKLNMTSFEGLNNPEIEVTNVNYLVSGYVSGDNILAKEIIGEWDSADITYRDVYPTDGSQPVITYAQNAIDYFTGVPGELGDSGLTTLIFNVTDLFRKWLHGTNNGFALVAEENTAALLFIDGSIGSTNFHSYFTIDYVDTSGSNDSFEYLTQEIGRAGSASVNTFSRSLTMMRSDIAIDGLRSPANIGFSFNPALKNFLDYYMSSTETDIFFPYGNNWLPMNLQGLIEVTEDQWQAFTGEGTLVTFTRTMETVQETDSNGNTITTTQNVFKPNGTSDSGYSLEIIDESKSINNTNLRLISPDGSAAYFNDIGFVYAICDSEDEFTESADAIRYSYSSNNPTKITQITDGVGRQFVFEYSNGLVTKVNCLSSDGTQIKAGTTDKDLCVTYTYDESKNLTGVTFPDGKTVSYTYSGDNLVKVQNIDNYSIQYTYDTLGKVTKITEKSGDTQGNFITLEELNNRQVKITDAYTGVEIQQFGKDGRLHYTFDDNGNLCKSDYAPANEDVLLANGWEVESENLLKNGSFDTATDNLPKDWENAFTIDFTDVTNVYDNSCKVFSTEETTKLQSQTVDVDGGKNFTFSLYAKNNGEEIKATDKLYIRITAVDEDENETSKSVQINPTNEFEQYSVSVSTTTETDYVTVEFGLKKKTGDYLVNNAQLERGNGTAEFNYIENGTFTLLDNGVPERWSTSTVVNDSINGESVSAVKLQGGLPEYDGETLNDSISAITQTVKINGKKGDIYSVGGWFKGLFDDNLLTDDMELELPNLTKSNAQIKVSYKYDQTTTNENGDEITQSVTENFAVEFSPNNNGWQYAVDSFALKADVTTVDVTVIAKNIISDSYTTNISFTKNELGGLVEENESEESDGETCTCGCEDCAYGENCPCTGAINNDCQCPECLRKETTTEDAYGNTLSNKSTDGIKYIETLSSYTTDGNYLATYTDERGNVTTYDYNTLNGILESVTSPMGTGSETTTTSYEYDEMGNVVSVSTGLNDDASQTLEYVYTNDSLTELITPNGKFRIIYDAWGQVLSVNVVNTNGNLVPLVEYTYNSGALRTQVATATYRNAADNDSTYQYTYDTDGNVTKVKINNVEKHKITYSSLGEITGIENKGGRKVQYTDNGVYIYNASNELVYTSVTDSEGENTEENYGIKYKEHDLKYNYDSATGSSSQTSALDIAKYYRVEQTATTDWFGREDSHQTTIYDITEEVSEKEDATGNVIDKGIPPEVIGKISTEYEYPVADDGKTSSNVEKYINKTYNGSSDNVRVYDGYYYEYDKQNKISAEKTLNADGTTTDKYSYEYDEFGQLVRFNDAVENKTYTYTYDNNGNILTKSEYAYTTGDLGTATNTTTYGYDTQWKDKLTTIGDKTITYDNIGNPTSYLGAALTWEGRNLKSYETEEQKLQYEYDENGMRYRTTITNKEDNSVGYLDYVWVDSKLISISFTSDELNQTVKYLYNDFDEPVGFVSTREDGSVDTYYYLKNAQGDITNIVSAAGKKMVSFTYDVFGKRTVEYQANGSTNPGQIELLTQMKADLLNPFAYRGYCYDYDMGMYYLQSRYYDPNTGRFINADDTDYLDATGTVLGCNLFAYCENDPVNNIDPRGNVSIERTVKVLNRILECATNVAKFLLDKFGLSRKRYMTISKYKKPKAIYSFVYNNKKSLKNFKNKGSDIAKFINIVLDIVDLSSVIKGDTSCARAVAEIVFFGFIKLLTYAIPKLVAWLITTICKVLKLIKSVIEDIISYILEDLLESKGYQDLVRKNYLTYVDKQSKLSFKVFIYGLFYGVKKCFV